MDFESWMFVSKEILRNFSLKVETVSQEVFVEVSTQKVKQVSLYPPVKCKM